VKKRIVQKDADTGVYNMRVAASYLIKAHILAETISRRFDCKFVVGELSAAARLFLDYELSVLDAAANPEHLAHAQLLIHAAMSRLGFVVKQEDNPLELVTYSVQLLFKERIISKFVTIPAGVDCEQYVLARFGEADDFLGCSVDSVVTSEEERERIKLSRPKFSRILSDDEQWLYDKMRDTGLSDAMTEVFRLHKSYSANMPRDVQGFTLKIVRSCTQYRELRDALYVAELKRRVGCPDKTNLEIWHSYGVAFLLVDERVRAVTLTDALKEYGLWAGHLKVINSTGMPWVPMRQVNS